MTNQGKLVLHWAAMIDKLAIEIEAFAQNYGLAASHRIMVAHSSLVWASRNIAKLANDKEITGE